MRLRRSGAHHQATSWALHVYVWTDAANTPCLITVPPRLHPNPTNQPTNQPPLDPPPTLHSPLQVQASKDCVQKTINRLEQKLKPDNPTPATLGAAKRALSSMVFLLRASNKVVQQRAAMSLARLAPEEQLKSIFIDKRGIDVLLDMLMDPAISQRPHREAATALLQLTKKLDAHLPGAWVRAPLLPLLLTAAAARGAEAGVGPPQLGNWGPGALLHLLAAPWRGTWPHARVLAEPCLGARATEQVGLPGAEHRGGGGPCPQAVLFPLPPPNSTPAPQPTPSPPLGLHP